MARHRRRTYPRRDPAGTAAQAGSFTASAARRTSTSARPIPRLRSRAVRQSVFGWIFGAQHVDVEDEETWAQIDAEFAIDSGAWTGLQFGVRYSEHSARVARQ